TGHCTRHGVDGGMARGGTGGRVHLAERAHGQPHPGHDPNASGCLLFAHREPLAFPRGGNLSAAPFPRQPHLEESLLRRKPGQQFHDLLRGCRLFALKPLREEGRSCLDATRSRRSSRFFWARPVRRDWKTSTGCSPTTTTRRCSPAPGTCVRPSWTYPTRRSSPSRGWVAPWRRFAGRSRRNSSSPTTSRRSSRGRTVRAPVLRGTGRWPPGPSSPISTSSGSTTPPPESSPTSSWRTPPTV